MKTIEQITTQGLTATQAELAVGIKPKFVYLWELALYVESCRSKVETPWMRLCVWFVAKYNYKHGA